MKYCSHCGNDIADEAVVCVKCGCSASTGKVFCRNCGNTINENAVICVKCGCAISSSSAKQKNIDTLPLDKISEKDWLTTLLLLIFTGGVGGHNYYVGNTKLGIIKSSILLAGIPLSIIGIGFLCFLGLLAWTIVELVSLLQNKFEDSEGKIICQKN